MEPPVPGSESFLASLIQYIEAAPSLDGWQPDSTLLSVLLIATIVQKGGIIVDVKREAGNGKGKARAREKVADVHKVAGYLRAVSRLTPGTTLRRLIMIIAGVSRDLRLVNPSTPRR
jgi:hypothetical protein